MQWGARDEPPNFSKIPTLSYIFGLWRMCLVNLFSNITKIMEDVRLKVM